MGQKTQEGQDMDKKTILKLLEGMTQEELIEIIINLANYSEKGERWLLEYCRKNGDKKNQIFIIEKQLLSHWRNAEGIIGECNCYGGGPREDEGYEELYAMDQIVEKHDISWDVRKEIIDGMMEQFKIGNSGFDDSLVDTSLAFCKEKEEKLYLAGLLKEYGGNYYQDFAANMYLQLGEEESFVEVQKNNLHYGSEYIKLADYYKKKKDIKRAVLLMEEALKKAEGRMDEIYSWLFRYYASSNNEDKILKLYETACKKKRDMDMMVSLLYEYYKEKNDYEKQKEYLLLMMKYSSSDAIRHWFHMCRAELHPEDFESNRQKIYEQLKAHSLKEYCEVLMTEGNEAEVLNYLNERTPYDDFWAFDYEHRFSRRLAKKFPKKIIDYYQKECECYCSMGRDKNYHYAAKILKEIKKLMVKNKMEKEWDTYFEEFMERHKRKKNLMKRVL